ncbi:MAG: glycerophosphodiester phosphodiesterase family protein [Candidatus Krumholzibacteria bacterium]|nr:glycerophosphodiester phosphodiesterase family protein [Candidatus Krumholzibacteria bacterium]
MAPSWLAHLPVAHRGLHDAARGVPENSLAAFDAAVAGGYAIELDVRATRDGRAVVFHDAELRRMTGRTGAVDEASSDDVAGLRLRGTDEGVPLLTDVLARVDGRAPILIEVKNEDEAGGVESATLAALERYAGPFAVQSFNPETLVWFAARARGVALGLLYSTRTGALGRGREFQEALERLDARAPLDFLGLDARALPLDPPAAAALRARFTLLAWTIISPAAESDARRWCHNVIFEGYRPERHAPPGGAVV